MDQSRKTIAENKHGSVDSRSSQSDSLAVVEKENTWMIEYYERVIGKSNSMNSITPTSQYVPSSTHSSPSSSSISSSSLKSPSFSPLTTSHKHQNDTTMVQQGNTNIGEGESKIRTEPRSGGSGLSPEIIRKYMYLREISKNDNKEIERSATIWR